ncbi:MAG: MoxR family ATPase [Lachnospiraceae bacterium]|nr:MoxR family ATPase [Lachnospiraceae bacterium]
MNIRDAKQEIIHTIMAYTAKNEWGSYAIPSVRQRPILLIGPPGIGKTAVMQQAASACGVGFVSYSMTHHTRQSAIGLPFLEQREFEGRSYSITEYTMSEIISSVFCCMEESGCREGLLFLDEINCVSETLAPAILQLLQNKTFGNHRLPEGWVLATAGNPQEYNKSVREFDIATLDRLKYIKVEADYDAWRPYALENNLHAAILSYLDTHREQFYVLHQTYIDKTFVTARGWEDLSCLLLQYELLHLPVTPKLIGQYLHSEELANDFAGYYQVFTARKQTLPVTAMLDGDEKATEQCLTFMTSSAFDGKLHLVHLMLSCIGTQFRSFMENKQHLVRFQECQERLERFWKQQKAESIRPLLSSFLAKEREIMRIRQEHGLSSGQEIEEIHRVLYEFQTLGYQYQAEQTSYAAASSEPPHDTPDEFFQYLRQIHQTQSDNLEHSVKKLHSMVDYSIQFLEQSDGPELTIFLSSLSQNRLAAEFFRRCPCESFTRHRKLLEFGQREQILKQKLEKLF